jgi:hypothetical protein
MTHVQLLLTLGTAAVPLVYLAYFCSQLSARLVGLLPLPGAWLSSLLPEYSPAAAGARTGKLR